jgi:hypothetical protein
MKTKTLQKATLLFVAATFLMSLFGIAAFSIDFGAQKITLDDTTKATSRYLPVSFDHKSHIEGYGITCVTCHHTEKETFTSGAAPACSTCHNSGADISYKESMHNKCVVCHIKENTLGKKAPAECLSCHVQRP